MASLRAGLARLGLLPGSVLCLWSSNHPQFWLVCLAAWQAGAATLAVNCLVPGERLEEQLKETGALLLVCDSYNQEEAEELLGRGGVRGVVVVGQEEGRGGACTRVEELLQERGEAREGHAWDWDREVLSLSYTSRDGRSRLVQHTNRSLVTQVFPPKGTSNHWFDQFIGDSFLCGLWFFHFTGLHSFALSAIHGLSMAVMSEYSDKAMLTAVQTRGVANAVLYSWQVENLLCPITPDPIFM